MGRSLSNHQANLLSPCMTRFSLSVFFRPLPSYIFPDVASCFAVGAAALGQQVEDGGQLLLHLITLGGNQTSNTPSASFNISPWFLRLHGALKDYDVFIPPVCCTLTLVTSNIILYILHTDQPNFHCMHRKSNRAAVWAAVHPWLIHSAAVKSFIHTSR